jgi:hypothetical protein
LKFRVNQKSLRNNKKLLQKRRQFFQFSKLRLWQPKQKLLKILKLRLQLLLLLNSLWHKFSKRILSKLRLSQILQSL